MSCLLFQINSPFNCEVKLMLKRISYWMERNLLLSLVALVLTLIAFGFFTKYVIKQTREYLTEQRIPKIELGQPTIINGMSVLVQRYAGTESQPFTGFFISIQNPPKPHGREKEFDITVSFQVEPPQARHPDYQLKELQYKFMSKGEDQEERRWAPVYFTRTSKTGEATFQSEYSLTPNNRHEIRQLMDNAEKLAMEVAGDDHVTVASVNEIIGDGRATEAHWRHAAQARREYAYRRANPEYIPSFFKSELNEMNDAIRATILRVAKDDPLISEEEVMFGTTDGPCIEDRASKDGEGYWDRVLAPAGKARIRIAYKLAGKMYIAYFETDSVAEVRELTARSEGDKVFLTVNGGNEYRPWLVRNIDSNGYPLSTAASDIICDDRRRK